MASLDVVKAIEQYVHKIVTSVSGLKVLLLDEDTVIRIVFNNISILNRLKH